MEKDKWQTKHVTSAETFSVEAEHDGVLAKITVEEGALGSRRLILHVLHHMRDNDDVYLSPEQAQVLGHALVELGGAKRRA